MTTFTDIVLAQVKATGAHAPNVAMIAASVMGDAIIEILAEKDNPDAATEAKALGRCVKALRAEYQLTPHQPVGQRFNDVTEFSSPT